PWAQLLAQVPHLLRQHFLPTPRPQLSLGAAPASNGGRSSFGSPLDVPYLQITPMLTSWPGSPCITSLPDRAPAQEPPAFLKADAAYPAAPKVALASSAVIATVVSISDRLPPAAAANMAAAAALSSGNSPITNQSWGPNVRYQPMSLPPTLLKSLERAC